ncbi:hypothetical protein V4R08_15625 (plasmid) [Nitrobacter sp. NHB1]|uniref:hypothetical protein n=1 Tax=Nitrobacter sp. NHB1 TaxID=3119830 RepID=UPI002FFFBE5C
MPSRPRQPIAPADAAKGEAAELAFRQGLDAAVLPHIYVEQSPLTVPLPLRGQIKRPDYIVGIPGVSLVAFDVKAKTIYPEGVIFDLDEVGKLRTFARLFHCTVYFACLNPEGGERPDYWIRLDQLDEVPAVRRGKALTLCMPIERALPVSMDEPFYSTFVRAVALN